MTTTQEIFDALGTILTEKEIVDELVKKAMGYLQYDDDNPDIGMGMFVFVAVNRAKEALKEEAELWKRKIYISDSATKLANDIVKKKRAR